MKYFALYCLILVTPALADVEKARLAERSGDFQTAFDEYKLDAEEGDAEAQAALAMFYAEGIIVKRDRNIANQWTIKAAKQGNKEGQYNLGLAYQLGLGNLPISPIIAFEWFLSAAKLGEMNAQYETAVAYQYGRGTTRNFEQSRHWYLMAAEQNHSRAQNNLAVLYGEGLGVNTDRTQAMKWLIKAADNKNEEALYSLGLIHHQGVGVKKDFKKAAEYFEYAFIGGKSAAAEYLSQYYYLGTGARKNKIEAMKWLMLATELKSTATTGMLHPDTQTRLLQNKRFLKDELSENEMTRAKRAKEKYINDNLQ